MNRGKNLAILIHEWIVSETRLVEVLNGEIDENWPSNEIGIRIRIDFGCHSENRFATKAQVM